MEHKFISKRYWEEQPNAMAKADVMAKSFNDVINLSIGDPDKRTSKIIIDKAYEDALAGHTRYTAFKGDPELRQEIVNYYKEEFDIEIPVEEVFVCTSACLGMYNVLEAVLDDGDEVIVQAPYFSPYKDQIIMARGIPVELDSYEEEDFQINVERLKSLITDKTKALIINSPNNPTGNCLTEDSLRAISKIAEEHDLLVISDEIYTDYSYQNKFVPMISIPEMRERTVTINSFSKNFVMTGWRIGNIVAPECIIDAIKRVNDGLAFTAPSVSQRAAIAALRNRKEVQKEFIEEFKERIFYAAERVNKIPKMHTIYPPKGTFYIFINIKDTGLSSTEVCEKILEEAHVLMLPGIGFGRCGEGYLRVSCTVGIDKLKEAFDRIEQMEIFR